MSSDMYLETIYANSIRSNKVMKTSKLIILKRAPKNRPHDIAKCNRSNLEWKVHDPDDGSPHQPSSTTTYRLRPNLSFIFLSFGSASFKPGSEIFALTNVKDLEIPATFHDTFNASTGDSDTSTDRKFFKPCKMDAD